MADRSHLTPVEITDWRGRRTTVYRNLGAKEGALRTPRFGRTHAETNEFLRLIHKWWPEVSDPRRRIFRREDTRLAATLAMNFVDTGSLGKRDALWVLAESTLRDDRLWLASDALRLAVRFQPRWEESGTHSEELLSRLVRAARGYRHPAEDHDLDGEPITTQEQLDSCAAVIEFTLRFADGRAMGPIGRAEPTGKAATGVSEFVENPHLNRLIRERPRDLDRISTYVAEHGMHPGDPEDAYKLRAWLDAPETPAPFFGGWL
ncbi:hypothetical protein ACX801_07860 [Arthrobacter bambusae]